MRTLESKESFALLAARSAHAILRRLRHPEDPAEVDPAPLPMSEEPPRAGRREAPIGPDSMVEFVGRSVLFAPQEDHPNWLIFVDMHGGPKAGFHEFESLQRIDAEVEDATFLETVFRLLLNRAIDAGGYRNYLNLLRSGEMDRRDILKALLGSPEAQAIDRQYLVVPEASPWLSTVAPQHKRGDRLSRIRIAA